MNRILKKYISIGSSMLIVAATFVGIPIKAYIKHVKYDPKCVETGIPRVWTKHMAKTYAFGYMRLHYPEWNKSQWRALVKLWGKESAWDHTADNPNSSAYGIAQILHTKPGTPAPLQIERGLEYIKHRYNTPAQAWTHWRKHGWY